MATLLDALETPAPLVDLERLARNLDRMAAFAAINGLALRPHIKTHKSTRIAAEQLDRGAVGLTCATPFEAEVMSEVCADILLAHPPVGQRAHRIAALPPQVRVTVALDSMRAIEDIGAAAKEHDRRVQVLIEMDMGMHRVGVQTADEAIELARMVRRHAPLDYAGIMFYPGHIRAHVDAQDAAMAQLAGRLGVLIEALDRAGVRPRVVSGGSTPTAWRAQEIEGLNEIRPGTYVYNDRTTAGIGACEWEDCALTVLATVVSTAVPGQAVVDAGSKALGREPMRGGADDGFGILLEYPEVTVTGMSEEHGILDLSRSDWKPAVGERVRIIPNHVCIVVHLNDLVYGVRGDVVETSWSVAARGRGLRQATAWAETR
ncbi:MAG TPA: alanine racemase [Gemmatimonadaceae bacterium]|nr:alanine racemase [Gemmatimonadaceae bacterium]